MPQTHIHIVDLDFQQVPGSVAVFVAESHDGLVLIETGPYSTLERLKVGLQALGFTHRDVRHVLLSHIHLDHAGAAWYFAKQGAKIYVHPMGLRHLADPSRLMESARMIYQHHMERLWGDMRPIAAERIQTVEHAELLKIGGLEFKAWHTPGHAVHHIAWQLDGAVFTGDVAGVRIGGGPVVAPCPPPDINIEDWQASLQCLRQLEPEILYLTHFGRIAQVMEHLDALEECLLSWAAWMEPYARQGADPVELTPLFQAFVQENLRLQGLDEQSLKAYETANPSWMSVAGLMRYWKKKMAT